jgi:hypothetical protein
MYAKPETLILLEENTGKTSDDVDIGNIFDRAPITRK